MCKNGTKETFEFKRIIWTKIRNIIVELCDYYDIEKTNFKYDYLAVFDLESVLIKTPSLENTDKLQFISTHVAVSASITSNIPEFIDTKFIISKDPRDLWNQIFTYFDQLSSAASILMQAKFNYILALNLDTKNRNKIIDHFSCLPILGFNSSFYDVGLLAKDGFDNNIITRDNNPFTIKDGNRNKVIKTNQLIFLDQMSYCAAGTSL